MELLYQEADIYVGIRSCSEFIAGKKKGIFDFSIWIERPGYPLDESCKIKASMCDAVVLNDGTLEDLAGKAGDLVAEFNLGE